MSWYYVSSFLCPFTYSCTIVDVPNGSTANGQVMQIYTCFQGNTNQLFTVTNAGTGQNIEWTNKGKCLDLTDGDTAPGTKASRTSLLPGSGMLLTLFIGSNVGLHCKRHEPDLVLRGCLNIQMDLH